MILVIAALLRIILIGLIALITPMILAALIIGGSFFRADRIGLAVAPEWAPQHTVEMPAGETILPPSAREAGRLYDLSAGQPMRLERDAALRLVSM